MNKEKLLLHILVMKRENSLKSNMLNKRLKKHNFCVTLHISMVAHFCHGKTKNFTSKTKTSRQNQKPHGKNKIPHGKTKNLTAKTKYLTAKPNISQQNQNSFGFAVRFLFLP